MVWIVSIFLGICLIFLALIIDALYGTGDCDNIWQWVKELARMVRETAEKDRAERAFLRVNPLCTRCMMLGKYRKAKRMWTMDGGPEPLCEECYQTAFNQSVYPTKEA